MLSERALRECGGLAAKGYNSTYLTVPCTPGYDATEYSSGTRYPEFDCPYSSLNRWWGVPSIRAAGDGFRTYFAAGYFENG